MIDNVVSLIKECLSGIKISCEIIMQEFASMIMNILNGRFSIAQHDKDDIFQNVYVKLMQGGLKNFNGNTQYEFIAYLNKIVRNEAYTHLAYIAKGNTISINQERALEGEDMLPFEMADDKYGQEDAIVNKELLGLIERALSEYPLLDRQVFLMKVDGVKDRGIANILKISIGTVASKYSRVREKLRQILDS